MLNFTEDFVDFIGNSILFNIRKNRSAILAHKIAASNFSNWGNKSFLRFTAGF